MEKVGVIRRAQHEPKFINGFEATAVHLSRVEE